MILTNIPVYFEVGSLWAAFGKENPIEWKAKASTLC